MTDAVMAGQGVDSANPTLTLRESMETRIARIEEEINLIERQYRQLQTNVNQEQERRDSAEAIRQLLLSSIGKYGPEEIRTALDEHTAASIDLALIEQRFQELADRRAEAKDRLVTLRADLEVVTDLLRDANVGSPNDANANFRNASRQVFQVIEQERMRIARDMHDGPAQSMSNLVLQAEILERLVSNPDAILAELQDFKRSVRGALDETRQLIFDLRPMTLDDLGLVPTLRKLTEEYSEKHGIHVRLTAIGEEVRLPGNVEGTLFRIIQEALTNVLKHAHARSVEVSLNLRGDRISATVRDDGEGFDVHAVEARVVENRNLGLIGMRERCELEHGVLQVKSQPGKGTEIHMEFRLT